MSEKHTTVPMDGVKSFGKDPYLNEIDIHFDSEENMIAFFNAMQRYFDPSASVNGTQEKPMPDRDRTHWPYTEIDMLRKGYAECLEDMVDWASYAGDYFREKHDLAGDIVKHQTNLSK